MKHISIQIRNAGMDIKFDLEVSASKSHAKVQRALVYQFFDYYDTMRRIKAVGFKATEPFNVAMHVDGVKLWDTAKCSVQAQAKLKLINNPKGRSVFESRLGDIVSLSLRMQESSADAIIKSVQERLMTAK